ncbi:uncharacterized protein N0V89_002256 [Didymosphaeria variabile]|uniref:NAD(P)-binding protein n=1 Tax=Didymosphaeria variabile TaxID=1932322 RepID=A0A9W9CE81_9PLEO|nr:uncharacterized protein N0V89_002256 [Didymosphaeria variabile]KAJ4357680.1 hypothetical protein N0V89_002256 [Didymosphaeria variabile]
MASYKRVDGAALVTGSGSGMGRAVSVVLSVAGITRLYLTDLNRTGLEETKSTITSLNLPSPPTISLIPGDISSPAFISSLFSQIPQLDYAVNCAGIMGETALTTEATLEGFDKLNAVNYRGLWMCVKEELKLMLKNDITPYTGFTFSPSESQRRGQRGSIINIASQLGLVGKTQAAIYTATKAAVLSLTRSDAIDYSGPPHHIRINSVCPGVIETPLTMNSYEGTDGLEKAVGLTPMGRIGLPSEVADTVVWLCSGESSFVTGSGVVVDGGYVIH